jgi:aldose sugar dehydrogenase
MRRPTCPIVTAALVLGLLAIGGHGPAVAQDISSPALPELPVVLATEHHPIRVSALATGLENPWSIAFLPGGDLLVTERPGRLRILRDGQLDPEPVRGVPAVHVTILGGLFDVALHPQFEDNRWVYLSFATVRDGGESATALARGRFDEEVLSDVETIFVANNWSPSPFNFGGRIAFDNDGYLYLTVGDRLDDEETAQDVASHGGKVLRLNDDGSVPASNPFAGIAGHAHEVFSLGHRNAQGLALHPQTGSIWQNEHGPLGGDEINIILPGRNYGWPLVSYGVSYEGEIITDRTSHPDMEDPHMYWTPSIAISGLSFYTGDRFAQWRGNAFVGAMMYGRTRATGHVQRLTFNDAGNPIQREPILFELRQRIRDVRPGPDGFLYVLTDENPGAVLLIEPAG